MGSVQCSRMLEKKRGSSQNYLKTRMLRSHLPLIIQLGESFQHITNKSTKKTVSVVFTN